MKKSIEQRYIESLISKEPKLKAFLNENSVYLNEFSVKDMALRFKSALYDPKTKTVIDYISKNMRPIDAESISSALSTGNTTYAAMYVPIWATLFYLKDRYGADVVHQLIQRASSAKNVAAKRVSNATTTAKRIGRNVANKARYAVNNAGAVINNKLGSLAPSGAYVY